MPTKTILLLFSRLSFSFFLFARQEERRSTRSWGKYNITRRPEFISGPYRFDIGLETRKMLKQVQHDDIFVLSFVKNY